MISKIKDLEQVNQALSKSPMLSKNDLRALDIIRSSKDAVFRVGMEKAKAQQLPFTRLFLPKAHTGILIPKKAVDDSHEAIQIFLPGTGSTFSTAETMCDVAGTFHGRKSKNQGNGRKSNNSILQQLELEYPFKVASFPVDLPLNGMGSDAPFEFASERGLMAVLRHVHIVLEKLYPDRPVFIAGRSQGAIAAILYGQRFDDFAGVIAVNPPHPDPELFQYTIDYLEERAEILDELLHTPGIKVHENSWNAYKTFTPAFNFPSRETLVPVQVLVSLGDTFNLFPRYLKKIKEFVNQDSKHYLHVFDAGHNLWNRKASNLYQKVIRLQMQFISKNMKVAVE